MTKDNEGHDITVADSLPEGLAEWMCVALNLGVQLQKLDAKAFDSYIPAVEYDLAVLPELVEVCDVQISECHRCDGTGEERLWFANEEQYGSVPCSYCTALRSTLDRLKRRGE